METYVMTYEKSVEGIYFFKDGQQKFDHFLPCTWTKRASTAQSNRLRVLSTGRETIILYTWQATGGLETS